MRRNNEINLPDTELDDCPDMGVPTFDTNLEKPIVNPYRVSRRSFLRRGAEAGAALGAADFLNYMLKNGDKNTGVAHAQDLKAIEKAGANPHYLIYWFVEGGWESYDMFSPLVTENNVINRLPRELTSKERYRVKNFGKPGYDIKTQGNIRYGYLAEGGKSLFPDMAVLSSMHTGSFHSGDRLKAHMGSYNLPLQGERAPDERSVTQAFAEVYGQPYVLPNLSWHWWLSDGELNEVQYTGRKGYYHALGPAHAHTIYAGTPANLRDFMLRMQSNAHDVVNRQIERFLDDTHRQMTKDNSLETVKAYNSARSIYANMSGGGKKLSRPMLLNLFNDATLKERFKIRPADELITYQSVNGNKARTKFCPATNVQAMMTYEMMRADLSCAYFVETRNIRQFDSHKNRSGLWDKDGVTPVGQPDQTAMMAEQLWEPLTTLVDLLKKTPHRLTGKSLWEHTTIVLTSEFGRTIHGDVDDILKLTVPDVDKQKQIEGQDISQHWKVTSVAFLGGKVQGDRQYGGIGANTLLAVPLLPDGTMHPDFDKVTGEGPRGWDDRKSPAFNEAKYEAYQAAIPNHGDVYATALHLADIPKKAQTGRNDRDPLLYIKKPGT